jgi:hypothetical protein
MKSRLVSVALAFVFTAALAGSAEAQSHRPHLGPHLTYNFDVEEFGIGAQYSTPITTFLEFYPSFDYYFVDPGSLWALNADLKVRVAGEELSWLYIGGGLNISRASFEGASNTDTGLNLLAGWEKTTGRVHPFAELRLTFGDGSSTQIAGGLNFTLGGPR